MDSGRAAAARAAVAALVLGTASVPAGAVTEISNAVRIAAGYFHACVLDSSGTVKCWGHNGGGELGDGTTTHRPYAGEVVGLPSGVTAISLGANHSCAVTSAGGLKCWGINRGGELGDGTTGFRPLPVDVLGLTSGVSAVAGRFSGTCALTTAGGVKCWGFSFLGNGTSSGSLVPVDVVGLSSGVIALSSNAVGGHLCAITNAGGVKCWGFNDAGQLGDGTIDSRLVPVDVIGLSSGVASVMTAGILSCAVMQGGGVKCWGGNHGPVPVAVPQFPADLVALTDACYLTATGAVKCGSGDVPGLNSTATAIASGSGFTCAVRTDTRVSCWGGNFYGQLGNNTITNTTSGPAVTVVEADRPGPPASPAGWAGNGVATLVFGPPADDGGQPVTSYSATCNPGGFSANAGASPITVAGLSNGTPYSCAVAASNRAGTGVPSASVAVTPSATPPARALAATPASLDAGLQSMSTTSPPFPVTITNSGGAPINVTSVTVSSAGPSPVFARTHDCAALAAGASCTAQVTFSPPASAGPLLATVPSPAATLTVGSDDPAGPLTVALSGTAEKSLVTHYYRSILLRDPEPAGTSYWNGEVARSASLGLNVNEAWFAMAQTFFASPEYLALNRNNDGYVTDLYRTFFNRTPDVGGRASWVGQLDAGMPREILLAYFMFSPEFAVFTQGVFGNTSVRAEINAVVDFYRGFFSRLPDDGGFGFWVQRFRAAQCQGPAAVTAQAEAISQAFLASPEYAARARATPQYIGDLYNAFLRRGGDLNGVQFWINQVSQRSREAVRIDFRSSTEFQARVNAIIAQGCQN